MTTVSVTIVQNLLTIIQANTGINPCNTSNAALLYFCTAPEFDPYSFINGCTTTNYTLGCARPPGPPGPPSPSPPPPSPSPPPPPPPPSNCPVSTNSIGAFVVRVALAGADADADLEPDEIEGSGTLGAAAAGNGTIGISADMAERPRQGKQARWRGCCVRKSRSGGLTCKKIKVGRRWRTDGITKGRRLQTVVHNPYKQLSKCQCVNLREHVYNEM